jgi:hypothetical protein
MTDAATDTPTDTAEAPEAPNPIDVMAAALRGALTNDEDAAAINIFNALITAPADTRRMMASAILNTFADGDTLIIVTKPPENLPEVLQTSTHAWWPMQPAPGIAEMVQVASAREAASLAKGTFVTPAKPPAMERKLRLV